MDDKLTIEDLVAKLVAKHDMLQADAEAFVCSFFALIEEGLKRDKYVRIKGFGTFKLIDTDLGEGKMVFIPDASVRDAVNKPFAHFQPVELKDGVTFSDIEEEQLPMSGDINEDLLVEQKEETDNTTNDDIKNEDHTFDHQQNLQLEIKENNKKSPVRWCIIALILFAGIVIGCGIMWGVFSQKMKSVAGMEHKDAADLAISDTVSIDTISLAASIVDDTIVKNEQQDDTIAITKRTVDSIIDSTTDDEREIKYLSDEVVYKINGTIEVYTITKGSTLSKVAYRYYKNRKLWPYIVMHNKDIIQDPNNVPIGTVLRIPVLTPVE